MVTYLVTSPAEPDGDFLFWMQPEVGINFTAEPTNSMEKFANQE